MNDYRLRVVGLAKGDWEIVLADKVVAKHTYDELAKGVNLAAAVLASGPVADNVKKVAAAVKDKNRYFHDQVFRGVLLANAKSPEARQAAYKERMKKMPALDTAVREALQAALDTEYVMTVRPAK